MRVTAIDVFGLFGVKAEMLVITEAAVAKKAVDVISHEMGYGV